MKRNIAIGVQSFDKIREGNYFYIDKTPLIKEWWESGDDEESLKDTVSAALAQIEEKQYETALITKGIQAERIKKYGFAFQGKKVLIGSKENKDVVIKRFI